MTWQFYIILSALLYAIANLVDKYVISRWMKNPTIPVIVFSFVGLLIGIGIFIFYGFETLSASNILLTLIGGVVSVSAIILYFKAIKKEEVSRVAPLIHLSPLFVSLFATIFLGETFSASKYIGVAFLIVGSVLISMKTFRMKLSEAFWLMVLTSLLFSINSIILKYLLGFTKFWIAFSYFRIGEFLATIPLIYINFSSILAMVRKYGSKPFIVISSNEVLSVVGIFCATIAFSKGEATLVSALSSVRPIFVLFFATALSILYPKILREEIGKTTLAIKLIAIFLIFVGVTLVV